ncbi:MAG: alpha-L-fucosidase, partial [Methanococcaceae archaeon]
MKFTKVVLFCIGILIFNRLTLFASDANKVVQAHKWSAKNGSIALQTHIAPDDTSIGGNAAGDWVKYAGVDFGSGGYNTFMAYIAVDPSANHRPIEIRLDSLQGTSLGTMYGSSTGSWKIFKEKYMSISAVCGVHDVYLVFPEAEAANIDWFVFSKYNGAAETTAERDKRMQWWREARFGQFIHWGAYSVLGGEWNGVQSFGLSEWIMMQSNISKTDYEKYASGVMNPTNYDPKLWVSYAKAAGQKYMVLTSKHHEGLAMFDNEVTGFRSATDSSKLYDIVHFSKYGKDPMLELAQECKAQGIKFCVYHSILDWHHSTQTVIGNGDAATTMKTGQKDTYVNQMKEQIQELITKYDVELIWFDGEWSNWWTTADGQALYRFCRTLKPSLVINNRVGKRAETDGDFGTPEGEIPGSGLSYDWESCMTMNGTWGYSKYANNWQSAADWIRDLISIASKGGNLLLNVGPTPEGVVQSECVSRLSVIGQWLKVYGESIYATNKGCFPDRPSWGYATTKTGKVYCQVLTWPANGKLVIPPLTNKINKIYLLTNPSLALPYSYLNDDIIVEVPASAPNQYASVVVIDVEGEPKSITYTNLAANLTGTASNVFQNMADYNASKAFDGDEGTRWATDDNIHTGWLQADFGRNVTFNRVSINEAYAPRVTGYKIQYWNGTAWLDAYTGTTLGIVNFDAVTGSKIRLNITSVQGSSGPTIFEFKVYNKTTSGVEYSYAMPEKIELMQNYP